MANSQANHMKYETHRELPSGPCIVGLLLLVHWPHRPLGVTIKQNCQSSKSVATPQSVSPLTHETSM